MPKPWRFYDQGILNLNSNQMKVLESLKGVKTLNKKEQKTIAGGIGFISGVCNSDSDCPTGYCCQFVGTPMSECIKGSNCMV